MKIELKIESGRLTKKTKLICFGCFILVVTVVTIGVSLNNYNKKVRKAQEVVEAFGSKENVREVLINIETAAKDANVSFEEMADYMMKMGDRFGRYGATTTSVATGLKALEISGRSGKQAVSDYSEVMNGLNGALEKLKSMEKEK